MARYITITLDKRGVSCKARLLDDAAPRTCQALWEALPLSAPAFHGKYARNEIYALLPAFTEHDPGRENTTVTPIPGDVCWFTFQGDDLANPAYGYEAENEHLAMRSIIDLAIFYGRNNLLINGDHRLGARQRAGGGDRGGAARGGRRPARMSGLAAPGVRPSASARVETLRSARDRWGHAEPSTSMPT